MTREWIRAQQLPEGYVYVRDKTDSSTAPPVQVKQRHFAAAAQFYTERTLIAFVDDETTAVEQLRTAGMPAHTLAELATATDDQLLALTKAPVPAARASSLPSVDAAARVQSR